MGTDVIICGLIGYIGGCKGGIHSGYIEKMIKTIGADRVVMGSDGIPSTKMELAKAHNLNVSGEEREKSLGLSAIRLYNIK